MKRILLIALLFAFPFIIKAQAPQGFSYQAVIRNSSGSPIGSQSVKLHILLTNQGGTTTLYGEEHTLTTSPQGVANIVIGEGNNKVGTFASVPWQNGNIYIKVEVDPTGISGYQSMGDPVKLQSVPYALYSPNGIANGSTGQTLYYNGTAWSPSSILQNNGTNIGVDISPTAKLDVNGGIRLRSALYDNSASLSAGLNNQILTSTGTGVLWKYPSTIGIPTGTGTNNQLAVWSGVNSLKAVTNLTWTALSSLQVQSITNPGVDDPIFEVKNKDGKVVFGVYQGGVRVYVEDTPFKGAKGGFAVGGLNNQTKALVEYFRITPDSARIWVKDIAKGAKGGFAVGGLNNQTKLGSNRFMNITPENAFIGQDAGKSIDKGQFNVFIGYQAGMNTSGVHGDMDPTDGDNNIFLGYHAGFSNTNGQQNIYMGAFSGEKNVNGDSNTFLGSESGRNNTGYGNTLLGALAGASSQLNDGFKNTFIGSMCGWSNTTGNGNVFIGRECGTQNSSGTDNVYIGHLSGNSNTNGSGNVFIGSKAGWYSNQSNKLIIHNAGDAQVDIPNNSLIYGDFTAKTLRINANLGINTTPNSSYGMFVDMGSTTSSYGTRSIGNYIGIYGWAGGTGSSTTRYGVFGFASGGTTNYAGYFSGDVTVTGTFTNPSDRTLKKNIKPFAGALKKVMSLQGVTYEWKSETELLGTIKQSDPNLKEEVNRFNFPTGTQIGVIAQDVEKILPELVKTDSEGLKSVDYIKLTPILIEAIKEQQQRIQFLEEKVKEIDTLKAELEAIKVLLKK